MNMKEINDWADFWRYQIGVNVIPANAVIKKTWVSWKEDPRGNWQQQPIPQSIHDEWKKTFAFRQGMAVICGKVFHNESKKHLYLCAVDLDNRKAIEVIHSMGLDFMATKTLVERHANPDKAHIYFYTTRPMLKKSSDALNLEMFNKIQNNEVPALEVKGEGSHGIMYCTPSPHKDGSNYEIVGVKEPAIFDEIGDVVNKICDEYSLGKGKNNLVPMSVLMADDTKILEGSNRHEGIMRYAESILRKYPKMENQIFNDLIRAKNNRMCVPPLDDKQLEIQIECAKMFIAKQLEAEREIKEKARHRFGTNEFWSDMRMYCEVVHPTNLFVKCVDCDKMIDASPLNSMHYNHLVMFV